ncbi:MAG: PQQ-binding-like beta-propeller repeat protein, partial [Myxococcaceae bacterium]
MLRIRIGRRWTRERGAAPHDSVSLELDGVALVEGAEDEPLLALVESLLGCTGALARGMPMADISLPESGLVLCLDNGEDSCTLRIASLARPARLVRRVRLDWTEWCEAVVKMGEAFAADIEGSTVSATSRRAVRDRLRALR